MRAQADRERGGLLFAVGDGNHSLATAKECYERRKGLTDPVQWPGLPSRYALCELVNLHDSSLEFEPIHRVVFGVKPEELLDALISYYPSAVQGRAGGHVLPFVINRWSQGEATVTQPQAQLPVGTLQNFLDDYIAAHPKARVDYIHGADEARALAGEREDAVAFLLPPWTSPTCSPPWSTTGCCPGRPSPWGRPTTSGSIWKPGRYGSRGG